LKRLQLFVSQEGICYSGARDVFGLNCTVCGDTYVAMRSPYQTQK
jgi:hypothetical protein